MADNGLFRAAQCPVCAAPRTGMRCRGCGISYADPRVAELGRILLRADAIRRALLARPEPSIPHPGPATRDGPHSPQRPAPAAATKRSEPGPDAAEKAAPVGWILLGVGALCLAVAAAIFIAVTWDTLGWLQRGAIVLGVTAVGAALTEAARRKRLRASAEALAAVTGVLWTVTLVTGMRLLPDSAWWPALTGAALGGAALVADRWHARHKDRLWAVDAWAGLGAVVLFGGAYAAAGEWRPVVSVLAVGAGIAVHQRWFGARLPFLRIAGLSVGVAAALGLTGQGLTGLATGAMIDGWRVAVVLAGLGILVRVSPVRPVRLGSAACAGALGSGALMAATVRLPFDLMVWVVLVIAVPGVLVWLGVPATGDGSRAVRFSGLGWLVPPGALGSGLVAASLGLLSQGPAGDPSGPWWTLSTVGYVGLALATAVVRTRWLPRGLRMSDAIALFGTWTAFLVLIHATSPIALVALALALTGVLLLAGRTRSPVPVGCAATLGLWLCLLVVVAGWVAPTALAVVGLAALAWGYGPGPLRVPAQVVGWLAAPIAILLATGPLRDAGVSTAGAHTVTVAAVAALAALTLATQRWWWLDRPGRIVAESAGLVWSVAAALLAPLFSGLPLTSLCLLVFGVALVVAGRAPDRRAYGWIAVGVLTLSSWALLIHREVSTVEWYSLPTALVLLAIGTRTLIGDPAATSWRTLLPGLLIGLLPSGTLVVVEPVSPRALVVGVVALGLILAGRFRHLAACFVTGAIMLTVLAVVELWPYTAHVPRWAGFAAAGVLLVAVGVRWEASLRDLRRMGGYLRGLR